jgi:hypothetical protein
MKCHLKLLYLLSPKDTKIKLCRSVLAIILPIFCEHQLRMLAAWLQGIINQTLIQPIQNAILLKKIQMPGVELTGNNLKYRLSGYVLKQTRSIHSSRATYYSPHSVMLLAQTFVVRKRLLTLTLAKQRQKAKVMQKTYHVFIYKDLHYITLLIQFFKNALNTVTP